MVYVGGGTGWRKRRRRIISPHFLKDSSAQSLLQVVYYCAVASKFHSSPQGFLVLGLVSSVCPQGGVVRGEVGSGECLCRRFHLCLTAPAHMQPHSMHAQEEEEITGWGRRRLEIKL